MSTGSMNVSTTHNELAVETAPTTLLEKSAVKGGPKVCFIKVHVSMASGESSSFDVDRACELSVLNELIRAKLGHHPAIQNLLLGQTPLIDSGATLQQLGVVEESVLTLLLSCEPLGQHLLEKANGEKNFEKADKPSEVLTEFELQSWRVAYAASDCWSSGTVRYFRTGRRGTRMTWNYGESDDENDDEDELAEIYGNSWGNVGCEAPYLYWNTRSDGCRYEYWSTAPGDNEHGILVRIDGTSMRAIAQNNDGCLVLFEDCPEEVKDSDVVRQLFEKA